MARDPIQTRERLLQTAYEEVHQRGFQGLRVDEVLRQTGLQKGAFYHHFKSKLELGYAVLEEKVGPLVDRLWVEPLDDIQNPITDFPLMLERLSEQVPSLMKEHGCPLNNLAQEMASQDAGFQQRVAALFNHWIDAYARCFEQAQANDQVRKDVEAREIARFIVSALEGCIGVFKANQSEAQWQACQNQLSRYLQSIKSVD